MIQHLKHMHIHHVRIAIFFLPEFALQYGSSSRYSSTTNPDPWWSVTLPKKIYASKYRIKEPNYGAGNGLLKD